MTRAPAAAASACDPSEEPLSATSTSPPIAARSRNSRALRTHLATVAASFRHGIKIVNSAMARLPRKKKVPRRVPFVAKRTSLLCLVAAAGAGQVLRADVRAVGRRTAAPAEQARA